MERQADLFRPRDFIYMNTDKLNSYSSQLFGGLIQNVQTSEDATENKEKQFNISADAAAKFGLDESSSKLLNIILGQIGHMDVSADGALSFDFNKTNTRGNSFHASRTLEHFQYALFEESMNELNYLIDLNKVKANPKDIEAGQIRENLSNADFVKYTASSVSISDYRNASEFVKLVKKIIDLSIDYKIGEIKDQYNSESENNNIESETLRRQATSEIIASVFTRGQKINGLGEAYHVISEAVNEFFNGGMIPHNILLKSSLDFGRSGCLSFESQLKDSFLLEDRTELAYKYGLFEDAEWTIIGQVTSTKSSINPNFNEVMEETGKKVAENFKGPKSLRINSTVKEVIKDIDELSKKVGLLPLVDRRSIAVTPIAIYREPKQNSFFKRI